MASWFRKNDDGVTREETTDQISAQLIAAAGGAAAQPQVTTAVQPGPAAPGAEVLHAPAEEQRNTSAEDSTASAGDLDRLRAQRATLIELCLYALDRARSGGVVERLEEGLAGIGVKASRPDGDRFDPALHEAGGTVPTDDSALDGTVAETEVVGFSDGDKLLRAPIVTVYSARKGAGS